MNSVKMRNRRHAYLDEMPGFIPNQELAPSSSHPRRKDTFLLVQTEREQSVSQDLLSFSHLHLRHESCNRNQVTCSQVLFLDKEGMFVLPWHRAAASQTWRLQRSLPHNYLFTENPFEWTSIQPMDFYRDPIDSSAVGGD